MKINKQKILEILITALLSALIAFLQTLLSNLIKDPQLSSNPVVAGGIGILIKSYSTVKNLG